jgi:WD40 repeat protein
METESWSGRALAISPDGERLAIVRPDDSIGVWSLTTRRPIATLAAAGGHPDALAFSADGRYLAGVGPSGGHLWDTVPGVPVGPTLTDGAGLEGAQVYDLRFSADGSRLLARGSNDAVVAWTVTDKGLTGPST